MPTINLGETFSRGPHHPAPGLPIGRIVGLGIGAIVVFIALGIVFGCWFSVPEYERGVVTFGGKLEYVAGPGYHFKLPFVQSVTPMKVNVQQFSTPKLNTYTQDNQEVDAVLNVQFRVPADQVGWVYTNVADPEGKLQQMVIGRFKVEAGNINVNDFSTQRGVLVKNVYQEVASEAKRLYHIDVTNVELTNIDYLPSFREAQAQAAIVKTQIEQSQGLKLKSQIDADRAKIVAEGEANAAIQAAQGRAQATRLQADAEAHATLVQGEAQAKVQQQMAQALQQNQMLVEYEKAKRWNGVLPQNIYASAPIPFLNQQQGK